MSSIRRNISLFAICLMLSATQIYAQTDLKGSYQIDFAKSENVSDIIENATRNSRATQANRQDLENKLEAPQTITIDIRGNRVTLTTSQSQSPATFIADGQTKSSTRSDGSAISVRVSLENDTLTISSLGNESDYTLTFASLDRGRSMRVTRRITTDYLRQTIFADSFYSKTDSYRNTGSTDDGLYSSTDPNDNPNRNTGRSAPTARTVGTGNYVVPSGTILTGSLDNMINTKASQENDRFRVTIQSPSEYDGAVLEGYLTDVKRSGRVTGRSSFTMNFETIRLSDGRAFSFAGVLQSATDSTGRIIKTGDEGDARGDSRTKESIKRGGIGAGVGAILGAIIGGGKGAIIGATIGGGAGAGSVIAEGKEDVELDIGSTITVESTSPGN